MRVEKITQAYKDEGHTWEGGKGVWGRTEDKTILNNVTLNWRHTLKEPKIKKKGKTPQRKWKWFFKEKTDANY